MGHRVLLLNDTEEVYHWGCYGTSRAIKDVLLAKGVTEVDCVPVAQIHGLTDVPNRVADFGDSTLFHAKHPELANRLQSCDAVVINGEGTLHGFGNASRALLHLAFAAKHFFDKRVMLLNHSCYPKSRRRQVIDYYRAGYSSCDYVAVRETGSARIVERTLGVKCARAFDSLPLTIRNVYAQIPPSLVEKPYICLSGAVNYRTATSAAMARHLLRAFPDKAYVYLVGAKSGETTREDPGAYESLRAFIPQLKLLEAKSFTDWLSAIRHAEFLLSGRFHYTVAALSLGTPAICFGSNTPKISQLLRDLGLPGAIPRRPTFLFAAMLARRLRGIGQASRPSLLESFCNLAMRNYEWEI